MPPVARSGRNLERPPVSGISLPNSSVSNKKRTHDGTSEQAQFGTVNSPNEHGERRQRRFVISLDVGTTHTCIAFADKSKPDKLWIVGNFSEETVEGLRTVQIPTQSWYGKRKEASAGPTSSIEDGRGLLMADNTYFQSHTPATFNHLVSPGYKHGYEVQKKLGAPSNEDESFSYDTAHRVIGIKWLLDPSLHNQGRRKKLYETVGQLMTEGLIKMDTDILRDYLTPLLAHAKNELIDLVDLKEDDHVELVTTVPVCWTRLSNVIMTKAISDAMIIADFWTDAEEPSFNFFLVNEAEASATAMLAQSAEHFNNLDIFMILDCGGGTIDSGVYEIANAMPLRVGKQVTITIGAPLGGSDINQNASTFIKNDIKLSDFEYIRKGDTVETVVERLVMPEFETRKRKVIFSREVTKNYSFSLPGLQKSQTNPRIQDASYVISNNDMLSFFKGPMDAAKEVMHKQLDLCKERSMLPDTIVLCGGFGGSPALGNYLRNNLKNYMKEHGLEDLGVRFLVPSLNESATLVAKGAALRALDKKNGPTRELELSIGHQVDIHCPYGEDCTKGPKKDPIFQQRDKAEYNYYGGAASVPDTIGWLLKKGQRGVENGYIGTRDVVYDFGEYDEDWVQYEAIWISETCTEDDWQTDHPKNKDAQCLGKVRIDLNFLKGNTGKRPTWSRTKGCKGRKYYKVRVRLGVEIIDRDLKFFVRWPASDQGHVVGQRYMSFAAAYPLGAE